MTTIKALVLGSAAAVFAASAAQAADLPAKAKAVQYVKICSLYGAGFYYIPGTDTCIKLGGYVQFDANINAGANHQPAWNNGNNLGLRNRNSDMFATRPRVNFNIDTRTASEYGVVRTFWSSNFQFTTGDGPSSGVLTMDLGFIQFAGFTFGKAISGFQTPWGGSPVGLNTSNLIGGYDNATGVTQVAYTWQFGNGVSAQIGVEDTRVVSRAPIFNGNVASTAPQFFSSNFTNASGGNAMPDVVGNVRIDNSSFTAQLSAATHTLRPGYYGATELTGNPSSVWGYAVQGGLMLKNIPTGKGDKIAFTAIFGDGAPKYAIGGTTGNNFDSFGGSTSSPAFYQGVALGALLDGVYGLGGKVEKTRFWAVQGGYEHNWDAHWQTTLYGSYTQIDYNANATAFFCANTAAFFSAGSRCNPDFNIMQVGSRTAWTPVRNLTLSGELLYTVLETGHSGAAVAAAAGNAGLNKPAGLYEFKNQGMLSGNLRVRRTW